MAAGGRRPPEGLSSEGANPLAGFPCLTCELGCEADAGVHDILRLLSTDLAYSQFLSARWTQRLVATMLEAYIRAQLSPRWSDDSFLRTMGERGQRLALCLSAIFDFVTNVEYCLSRLGRTTDEKWIYCNPARGGAAAPPSAPRARVFYSFLKQCPACCLTDGLRARIEGAQHKPASHHIGEITGTVMALLLHPVLLTASPPFKLGLVTKQSHSVDAVAFRPSTAILLEIKASPLVTLPLAADLPSQMLRTGAEGATQYGQHSLVDHRHDSLPLYFLIPHRDKRIDFGVPDGPDWPYPPAVRHMREPEQFLDYLSAWGELYAAFAVPKTKRTGRVERVAYLTNGWGDEIDSNKTKPGLGRTDDMKKGTYQVLKYGAYYKDLCKRRALYSALVANLDPVNLWAEYLERLLDVRWTKERYVTRAADHFRVSADRLYYLFEAIVALNKPVFNEPALHDAFNFDRAHEHLVTGRLQDLLTGWAAT